MEETIVNFLKCGVCGYPLSIIPIYYHSALGSICGRCESIKYEQNDQTFERQFMIEMMVKNMIFPCAFRGEGCLAELKGEAASNHEQDCLFKITTVVCPLFQEKLYEWCTWIGHYSELVKHIKYRHENYFNNALKFRLSPELDTTFLFSEISKNIFMIFFNNVPHNNNLIIRIMTDMNYKQCQENKFEICFSSGASEVVFEAGQLKSLLPSSRIFSEFIFEIPSSSVAHLFKESSEIDVTISIIPKRTLEIFYQIDIEVSKNKPTELAELTTSVLQKLECPVCTELMGPPIHLCTEGHNICSRCRHKIMECPICRGTITSIRNLTLENICSIVTGPCIYRKDGCSYIDTISKVKTHEPFCMLAERRCVIKTCDWVERTFELPKHLKEKHAFKETARSYPYKIGMTFEQHLYAYDGKIFLMTLHSADAKSINFSIHCLGGKQLQYEYELRLIDPVAEANKIILRDTCQPIGYNFIDNSILLLAIPLEMCYWLVKNSDQINFMVKIHDISD